MLCAVHLVSAGTGRAEGIARGPLHSEETHYDQSLSGAEVQATLGQVPDWVESQVRGYSWTSSGLQIVQLNVEAR